MCLIYIIICCDMESHVYSCGCVVKKQQGLSLAWVKSSTSLCRYWYFVIVNEWMWLLLTFDRSKLLSYFVLHNHICKWEQVVHQSSEGKQRAAGYSTHSHTRQGSLHQPMKVPFYTHWQADVQNTGRFNWFTQFYVKLTEVFVIPQRRTEVHEPLKKPQNMKFIMTGLLPVLLEKQNHRFMKTLSCCGNATCFVALLVTWWILWESSLL